VLASLQEICRMLGVDPPQSLDQVEDPSWLTAAVRASPSVSEASDRESFLAEIKALSAPAYDQRPVDSWNELVSSDRARLLPRACDGARTATRSRHSARRIEGERRRARARENRCDHERSVRSPQVGSRGWQTGEKGFALAAEHARHAARDAGGLMSAGERLAVCGEESRASWPRAGSRRTRVRRVSDQAEGSSDRTVEAYQPPRRRDLLGAPPGRGSRRRERRAMDGEGCRAGDRVLWIAAAPAARRAERIASELTRDRALPGNGRELQRADRFPPARRRDQQLRRRAPRPPRRASGGRFLVLAADRANASS